MKTDAELLREYAQRGDETAFAEIVRRHVDFVYSAALRLLRGEAAAAQDVAQLVFADLARKAGTLAQRPTLAGWLHTSARYAAVTFIRRERRRRAREQEAATMPDASPAPAVDWDQIRPLLDEAVGRLGERDREAVLLRYFHNCSHREIGAALGLGEDAARKVVERALEKLRGQFARRGVAASVALLAAALPAHAVQPAPAAWSASAAGAALATPAVGAGAGLFTFLTMNTKLTALIALGITVAALACPWLLRLPYATVDETEQLLPLPDVSDMPPGWDAATSDPSGPPLMAKLPPIPVPPAGAPRLAAPNGETETALRLARLEAAQAAGIGAPSEPRGRASPPIAALPSGAISPLEEMINHLIGTTPAAARPYDLEIFALDPGTTNSYRIRADVEQIPLRVSPSPAGFPPPGSGAAYHLPAAGRFYLQWSDVSASARRYYGPFEGDPRLVLGLPAE